MRKVNYGRHLPAFILLFLAKEPTYGSMLLSKMEEDLPFYDADSPAIYRALNELEKHGSVSSYWETETPGAAKKYYTITNNGLELLKEFTIDIENRKRNLEFFLKEFKNLNTDKVEVLKWLQLFYMQLH